MGEKEEEEGELEFTGVCLCGGKRSVREEEGMEEGGGLIWVRAKEKGLVI